MTLLTNLNEDTASQLAGLLGISFVKVVLVLLVVYAVLHFMRRGTAAFRHWLCMLGLISALLLPILTVASAIVSPSREAAAHAPSRFDFFATTLAPVNRKSFVSAQANTTTSLTTAQTLPPKSAVSSGDKPPTLVKPVNSTLPVISWAIAILAIWLFGVLGILGCWLRQWTKIRYLSRRGISLTEPTWLGVLNNTAQLLKVRHSVRLLLSDSIDVPMTWGLLHPIISLPTEALNWSMSRRRVVLLHELAHVARWDYLTQWFTLFSCTVNWFNPLVWLVARQASIEREQASDDYVLNAGIKGVDYASHLIDIARTIQRKRIFFAIGLAMAHRSDLEQRIRSILRPNQHRVPLSRIQRALLVGLVGMLVLPLSAIHPIYTVAQSNPVSLTLAVDSGLKQTITEKMLGEFESANPGVTLTVVNVPPVPDAADGIDAHFAALQKMANTADVVLVNQDSISPQASRAGYFLDLAPLAQNDASLKADDFYPAVWQSFQWDQGIWALPFDLDIGVLAYDPAAFDRAGIAYPSDKWTLDDFVAAVKAVTVKDSSGHVTAPGFANDGRSSRVLLWRSLLGHNLVDDSTIPNQPQLDKPDVVALLDNWHQLNDAGYFGNDLRITAMSLLSIRELSILPVKRSAVLLPGSKGGLYVEGFAVSAATQHPDLAYALAKFLTFQGELAVNKAATSARKSLYNYQGQGSRIGVAADYQALYEQGLANGLSFADLRFMTYINNASFNISSSASVQSVLQTAEVQAVSDLKAADDKKGKLALNIVEPTIAAPPPGKIALKFDVSSISDPLPTQDRWDRVLQDFAASDPQVGQVKLMVSQDTATQAAANADCFYLPNNAVQEINTSSLVSLDPFLDADKSFDKADMLGNVMATVQKEGKTWALPLTIEPTVLRYDSTKFAQANLPDPANTWTIDAFADALKALKPDKQSPTPFAARDDGTYLLALIAGYGGLPIDYRTTPETIHFTDPATVNAIRQVLDLAKGGYIDYAAMGNLFVGGGDGPTDKTAIYPTRLHNQDRAEMGKKGPLNNDTYKITLFPRGTQYNVIAYDLGTAYISAHAQNPEACYRLISTLAQHPELFSEMPARHAQLTNSALNVITNPDTVALYDQIDTLLKSPNTLAIPTMNYASGTVSMAILQNWLFEAFDGYVLNGKDLQPALQDAEGYAKAYQGCVANLPALNIGDANTNLDNAKPYINCIATVDPRLKPMLDSITGQH
ncbi:MAG: extracellular solute-binding protein [Chloroflexota bacterium]